VGLTQDSGHPEPDWYEIILQSQYAYCVPTLGHSVYVSSTSARGEGNLQACLIYLLCLLSASCWFFARLILRPGLENREYGRKDPSRWPRSTLYPQKLALTSPTSGGGSVGIVRSRTQATEVFLILRHWRCRPRVPLKRRLTFNGLHGVISQETELSIITAVGTSNPVRST
jgi:hypothetical protein